MRLNSAENFRSIGVSFRKLSCKRTDGRTATLTDSIVYSFFWVHNKNDRKNFRLDIHKYNYQTKINKHHCFYNWGWGWVWHVCFSNSNDRGSSLDRIKENPSVIMLRIHRNIDMMKSMGDSIMGTGQYNHQLWHQWIFRFWEPVNTIINPGINGYSDSGNRSIQSSTLASMDDSIVQHSQWHDQS